MGETAGELGEVLGWIWEDFAGAGRSGSEGRRRKKVADFRGKEEVNSALPLTLTQALSWMAKGVEERRRAGFYQRASELKSALWNSKSTSASTGADGGETSEGDWQLMPPKKGLREAREERHCRSI